MVDTMANNKVSKKVNGLVKKQVTAYSNPRTHKIEVIELPRHKPPSRIRYEKSHPTISFRLDQELKSRLEEVLENESFASFVKEALGKREREKKSRKEARDEGYEAGYIKGHTDATNIDYKEGYNKGFNKAVDRYAVYARCAICGLDFAADREEDKIELARFMESRGWCHLHCKDSEHRHQK